MSMSNPTRRGLLRVGSALAAVGGAASTLGLQLAATGSAAAQSAPLDYKAIVCIFLFGGNDAHNLLLATDNDTWGRYWSARNTGAVPIALMPVGAPRAPVGSVSPITGRTVAADMPEAWGGVLPITSAIPNPVPAGTNASSRTFAVHPFLSALTGVWSAGRLAAVANVGPLIVPTSKTQYRNRSVPLPANLMSHNDQQSIWQAGAAEGARRGWGGLIADRVLSRNSVNPVFTAVSTAGNTVFLAGGQTVQYQITTSDQPALRITPATNTSLFGSNATPGHVRTTIRDTSGASYFMKDHSGRVVRSMDSADALNAAFASQAVAGVPAPTAHTNPLTGAQETNSLAVQLRAIARMIASGPALGMNRQVFFVSMGGFDNHDVQNQAQSVLLSRLAHAMAYFDGVLGNLAGVNRRDQVTTFTASDFSRTFTTNGDGTDHAWGAHHLVMGGAVQGGSVYGQYPTLGVDQGAFQNPDMLGNILIPTTPVDAYAGTIGRWFGLSAAEVAAIFPNLGSFPNQNMGFLAAGTS